MKMIWKIFVMVTALLMSIGFVVLLYMISDDNKQTENNTTEFVATVAKVNTLEKEGGTDYNIITNEYPAQLLINRSLIKSIDLERAIDIGDTIYFRVENVWAEQMNEISFTSITSLRTENRVFFALEDYNENVTPDTNKIRIMICLALVGLIGTVIGCSVSICKCVRNYNRPKENRG